MPIARRLVFVALAIVAMPLVVQAQSTAALTAPEQVSPVTASAGPRLDETRVGVRAVASLAAPEVPAPMRRADTQRSRTLMILGGAALLGGAIIGDDVGSLIMLGGLGVGLYGLYLHLQ